jgi:hypothetical protein
MKDGITAEKVYSLITTLDIPREAALNIIRSYGSRRVVEALEEAHKSTFGGTEPPPLDAEIEASIKKCRQLLDELLETSVSVMRKKRNKHEKRI